MWRNSDLFQPQMVYNVAMWWSFMTGIQCWVCWIHMKKTTDINRSFNYRVCIHRAVWSICARVGHTKTQTYTGSDRHTQELADRHTHSHSPKHRHRHMHTHIHTHSHSQTDRQTLTDSHTYTCTCTYVQLYLVQYPVEVAVSLPCVNSRFKRALRMNF